MNSLERAMLDPSGIQLDLYLEDTSTLQIMADIAEIRSKAALSTPAGALRERVLAALEEPLLTTKQVDG